MQAIHIPSRVEPQCIGSKFKDWSMKYHQTLEVPDRQDLKAKDIWRLAFWIPYAESYIFMKYYCACDYCSKMAAFIDYAIEYERQGNALMDWTQKYGHSIIKKQWGEHEAPGWSKTNPRHYMYYFHKDATQYLWEDVIEQKQYMHDRDRFNIENDIENFLLPYEDQLRSMTHGLKDSTRTDRKDA